MNRSTSAGGSSVPGSAAGTQAVFATTQWSVVVAAGQPGNAAAGPALEALCRMYWYPVYAFLRRRGISPADAEDFTQGFFARVLERGVLSKASPQRGRFRSFLLACLNHFVADERDKARAQRRGGGQVEFHLDFSSAVERYATEPAHAETADRLFDRAWALTVMERALRRLAEDERAAGREEQFKALQPFLTEDAGGTEYRSAATQLGLSTNAVAVAMHRLRSRFRDCVYAEVAATVAAPGDLEGEIVHLREALRSQKM